MTASVTYRQRSMDTHSVSGTVVTATAAEGYSAPLSSHPSSRRWGREGCEGTDGLAERVRTEQTNAFCLRAGMISHTHTLNVYGQWLLVQAV